MIIFLIGTAKKFDCKYSNSDKFDNEWFISFTKFLIGNEHTDCIYYAIDL